MPRPAIFDADAFLDAAAALYVDGGERAVTMAATARAAGAPSGSLYHRFPDRDALLAALWLRTVSRFHEGIHALLRQDLSSAATAVACAQHVVSWCARNGADARVLVAGRDVVAPGPWPDSAGAELRRVDARFASAVRGVVAGVVAESGTDKRIVRLAIIELPYAAVRPYLVRGRPIPAHVGTTVTSAVRTLLVRP